VDRAGIRRALGWALVAALTVAALSALTALASGDFDDTEWRVLGTSFGFAFLSATAAAGASARLRPSESLRLIGAATAVGSALTFALLVGGLWTDLLDDALWRAFGCLAILTVAGSHACLVLGARRPGDGEAIRLLVTVSLVAASVDALFGILPVSGLAEDEVEEGYAELLAALVVVLVFTTLMPPLLRRLQRSGTAPVRSEDGFAGEVLAIADRIEELGRGPGLHTPEIRREVDRLRRLAREHSG
jgi:MFS family permease